MTTSIDVLTDRTDVANLVSRFGRWLDGGPGEVADFYGPDAEVVSPRGRLQGLDAIADFLDRASGEHTQHVHSDLLIDLESDRGVVSGNQLVNFFEPGRPPYRTSGLRVTYHVARTAAGWRITRSQIELQWLVGDLPSVPSTT